MIWDATAIALALLLFFGLTFIALDRAAERRELTHKVGVR